MGMSTNLKSLALCVLIGVDGNFGVHSISYPWRDNISILQYLEPSIYMDRISRLIRYMADLYLSLFMCLLQVLRTIDDCLGVISPTSSLL